MQEQEAAKARAAEEAKAKAGEEAKAKAEQEASKAKAKAKAEEEAAKAKAEVDAKVKVKADEAAAKAKAEEEAAKAKTAKANPKVTKPKGTSLVFLELLSLELLPQVSSQPTLKKMTTCLVTPLPKTALLPHAAVAVSIESIINYDHVMLTFCRK
jgi:hypothetical protein